MSTTDYSLSDGSRRPNDLRLLFGVSPARAGMDPRSATRGRRSCPVRRTVSPARAGMDPHADLNLGILRRFPRTCGDGPVFGHHPPVWVRFPPHVRGWTLIDAPPRLLGRVSPARAGMDRSATPTEQGLMCFPRTCGDGPRLTAYSARPIAFPPHVRGWTGLNR